MKYFFSLKKIDLFKLVKIKNVNYYLLLNTMYGSIILFLLIDWLITLYRNISFICYYKSTLLTIKYSSFAEMINRLCSKFQMPQVWSNFGITHQGSAFIQSMKFDKHWILPLIRTAPGFWPLGTLLKSMCTMRRRRRGLTHWSPGTWRIAAHVCFTMVIEIFKLDNFQHG